MKYSTLIRSYLPWYLYFSIHPCNDSKSVIPGPSPPKGFCATNLTAFYAISTGIKTGVYSYDSNVEIWGFLSSRCFPASTSAMVFPQIPYFLSPIIRVKKYPLTLLLPDNFWPWGILIGYFQLFLTPIFGSLYKTCKNCRFNHLVIFVLTPTSHYTPKFHTYMLYTLSYSSTVYYC